MHNLTCIVCPVGCALEVNDMSVKGNKCLRGESYALEEIRAPKRTVTATASINNIEESCSLGAVRRVPVKTVSPCPREKIPALLDDIYKMKIRLPVKTGDIIISNWAGEGIDIIATRTIS
ncbi:MAG: DUF1667 domain-containing protein [Treponema sp.]|nr:DUF1667 domain-containing protein [Treponema sp.]